MQDETTKPGTPSTLALLEQSKALLAKAVTLLEQVEHTVRYEVSPLAARVERVERRVDALERRHPETEPAPAP